ncbi:hypothetical protein scyTo_0020610 [Scyliorhinus torazame]|uniref:FAD-binding FR-type domain-containing protein n=1 Tax=Scyliorhinus torazame TaxID=75743 RepID=A0A401PXB1_SCYTO|nr:hypothetical protein [Scyliorhinus torazame]
MVLVLVLMQQLESRSTRLMSSRRKTNHLERTVNNFRQEMVAQAKVCGILHESETVKRLRLVVMDKDFAFKAGQWVDFFIPGTSQVGGFSICSSPGLLERESVLELAVKYSKHPPAEWIHNQMQGPEGDNIPEALRTLLCNQGWKSEHTGYGIQAQE